MKLRVYTVCGEGWSLPVRLQWVESQVEEAGHPRKAPPTRHQHPRTFRKWISTLGKNGLGYGQVKSGVTCETGGMPENSRGYAIRKATYNMNIWSLLCTETSHRWKPGTWVAWLRDPYRQRPLTCWCPYTGPGPWAPLNSDRPQ